MGKRHVMFLAVQLQSAAAGGRNIYLSSSMDLTAVRNPLRGLIEKAIGWASVSSVQSCLITNPETPFSCEDPLPVDPDRDTLENTAAASRFVLVQRKSPAGQEPASLLQRGPFLARINRVQHL